MVAPVVPIGFKIEVNIARRQAGSYVDHKYVEPNTIKKPLHGSVQPATPRDLKSTPGGEEFTAGIKIFTDNIDGVKVTDFIEDYGSEVYRVIAVLPWQHHGYYKIIAGLVDG